ncbi:DEAD/DEAH box helicase family protein [Streptomyces virginiae]|uniref:DEAD/DEAH box helicase family protein n=1 Tax=Streptomyces virginiae TaxID=1961 RepID=UPI0037FEA933
MREDERRREYHADLPLVNTPTIRKVIATSRLLIQLNRNQVSARRGVILSGASGTGKTTALTQLGRAHQLAIRKRHPRELTGQIAREIAKQTRRTPSDPASPTDSSSPHTTSGLC